MELNDKMIDYLEEYLPELMATATKQAYWQTLESGQSVLIAESGHLVEVFPDGSKKNIREIAKPLSATIGERIVL